MDLHLLPLYQERLLLTDLFAFIYFSCVLQKVILRLMTTPSILVPLRYLPLVVLIYAAD